MLGPTKPCPVLPPLFPLPLLLIFQPSLTRPTLRVIFRGRTCFRALSWLCVISNSLLVVMLGALRLAKVMAMMSTRTRANAPRFRASSLRTPIQEFVRVCWKCMRAARMRSVRFRLGCAGPAEPITCAACNSGLLDTGAAHASCCALGEATRGHNAVSSLIHAAAQQCDHTSEMEVPGLIPGTDLRPADVLTSALGNAYTALDVSICSPHASEAGVDCTQFRVQAKLEHYGPHLAALLRQNISYTPIVWSAYGRPHPDTLTVLRSLSKSIARKRNIASAEVVFHRLHSSITLEIWRRSARQVRACWPVAALRPFWIWMSSPRPACCLLCARPVVSWCVAVFVLCPLCYWLLACSAHVPRLPMEAYHLGALGAEFRRFSARCTCSFHCSWLAVHFLLFFFGGLCSRLPHVPW